MTFLGAKGQRSKSRAKKCVVASGPVVSSQLWVFLSERRETRNMHTYVCCRSAIIGCQHCYYCCQLNIRNLRTATPVGNAAGARSPARPLARIRTGRHFPISTRRRSSPDPTVAAAGRGHAGPVTSPVESTNGLSILR